MSFSRIILASLFCSFIIESVRQLSIIPHTVICGGICALKIGIGRYGRFNSILLSKYSRGLQCLCFVKLYSP